MNIINKVQPNLKINMERELGETVLPSTFFRKRRFFATGLDHGN